MPQDYVDVMRRVIPRRINSHQGPKRTSISWILLPGLCSEAVGGEPNWAEDVAIAWFTYYAAAHLMDKIQDNDPLGSSLEVFSNSILLNAATGLYFSGSIALADLYLNPATQSAAYAVQRIFFDKFLEMSIGQHKDLITQAPDLQHYWEIAAAKSGSFFGLACKAGARLALDDEFIITSIEKYGYHLGMLVQILDDLEDFYLIQKNPQFINQASLLKSLAVVYASEVVSGKENEQFKFYLEHVHVNNEAKHELFNLLDRCGSVIYILSMIDKHRKKAIENIREISNDIDSVVKLEEIVQDLVRGLSS